MAKKKTTKEEVSFKNKTERMNHLKNILRQTNKKYGKNTVDFASNINSKERIPFGIKPIDELTGGGSVCGNFITIYGAESTGKTSICYFHIAEAQKLDKICVYIDLEHSFDSERAKQFGVNLEDLIIIGNLKSAEDAMDILVDLANNKVADLVLIDSIQAMSPSGEQATKRGKEKSIKEDEMALLAKKMAKFFRIAGTPVSKGKVAVVLIGQSRIEGIGSFFTREGLSGGRALKHFNMITLHTRKGSKADAPKDKKTKEIIGFNCGVKVEKHKITGCKPQNTEIMLPFYFKGGFLNEK
jgi:recombination protein RecA